MQKRRRMHTSPAGAEVLEDKTLLAATLQDGVLTVEGTPEADRVGVWQRGDTVYVSDNGERSDFPAADVTSVEISTGDGSDRIRLGRWFAIPASVDGGADADQIRGGAAGDTLLGGAGNDRIHGGDGGDMIDGGDGNDRLGGGDGPDTIDGGTGNDRIRAGAGMDSPIGGDGDDAIAGGADNDTLDGGAGNDRLMAGTGDNSVSGGEGDDTLFGNSLHDTLDGGPGENEVHDAADQINQLVDRVFERFDENADDVLTEEEVGRFWTRLADRADADGNGQIDRDELTQAVDELLADLHARLESRFSRFSRHFRRSGFGRFRG